MSSKVWYPVFKKALFSEKSEGHAPGPHYCAAPDIKKLYVVNSS